MSADLRKSFPSGWLAVAGYSERAMAIDALLDYSPGEPLSLEYVQREAGLSEAQATALLRQFRRWGIIEAKEDGLHLNESHDLVQAICAVNHTGERVTHE